MTKTTALSLLAAALLGLAEVSYACVGGGPGAKCGGAKPEVAAAADSELAVVREIGGSKCGGQGQPKCRINAGAQTASLIAACNQFPPNHPYHCSRLLSLVPKCPPGTTLGIDCKHMLVEKGEPSQKLASLASVRDLVDLR